MNKFIFTIFCAFALSSVGVNAQNIPNPSVDGENGAVVENNDNLIAAKEKNDKLLETYLLLPLEEPYDRNKVIRFNQWIETVPEDQQSNDFKATVKYYSDFLKNYEKYTSELQQLALRLHFIVAKNSHETMDEKARKAKNAIVAFSKGQLRTIKSSPNKPEYMPYSYFSIYKNSAYSPSIYYLDDRIEELNKAMENYIAYAENPASGKGANEAETLEILRTIASKLSPVPKARQVDFRPTIANTVVDPDKTVISCDSNVSQEDDEMDNDVLLDDNLDNPEQIADSRTIKDIKEDIEEIKKKRTIIKKTYSSYKEQYNKEKDNTLKDLIKDEEKKLVALDGKLNELYSEYESLMGEPHPDISKKKNQK